MNLNSSLGQKNGWYLKADASAAGYSGSVTTLTSRMISSTGPQCTLEFWYYMSGTSVGTLSVLTNDISSNLLWLRSGHQADSWVKGKIRVGSRRNFQVSRLAHRLIRAKLDYLFVLSVFSL